MKLEDAKMQFIQSWGTLGSAWGIPKSMAQIHALLLISNESLSAEEVMEATQLSRGNVNINLRDLITWGLVQKQHKLGERKEFFKAEQGIFNIARNVVKERKRREIEPMQNIIRQLKEEQLEGDKEEIAHFQEFIKELDEFISQVDKLTELIEKLDGNIFLKKMMGGFLSR